MAWPRKNTRAVVVDGEPYNWHLDRPEVLSRWVVIGHQEVDGQLLFLDPYDLSTRAGIVCGAIRFALSVGWQPRLHAKPMRVAYDGTFFSALPEDAVPGTMPHTLGAGRGQGRDLPDVTAPREVS